ncbi:protein translocase subunit SecD [Candidatus Nitronereus thalassa]|uniref:Protein translocase subunit SecD n=1 Tax=Candidatus Nitronereus thalassa TaxID=3020898 RepID=A0ABU3KD31_9BACT|nr:protein translocase subunit SecD [Candidatus Nitronereus thalassa]MDT7044162.1 protein translocase subunit SecD [Candidatus Nitronereus thalassa]
MKKVRTRLLLVLGLTLLSVYLSIPSWPGLHDSLPEGLKWVVPPRGVSLGLDLQGGIHMVMEVEEDRAVEIAVDRSARAMKDLLVDKGIEVTKAARQEGVKIAIELGGSDKLDEAANFIRESFSSYAQVSKEGNTLVYELDSDDIDRIKNGAINQALETIRNRIDQFGVTEPLLQRQGRTQIVIQLPGVKDPARAKALIQDTALLEFKMLDEVNFPKLALPSQVARSEEEALREKFSSQVPEGSEILFEPLKSDAGQPQYSRPYLVYKTAALTGDVLQDARVTIGDFSEPQVSVTFDSNGAEEFGNITTANVGKFMAIVLDGTVYSAPRINEPIRGGRAQITGNFTTNEANDLAIVLRAGALPAPMKILQDLTVGPSLGQDSIEKGLKTTMIAGFVVLIFMVVYYRMSGMVANAAVALNLICLFGALSGLNATLTLPGIAGIILTIGMGVDSNVLIFERIREELRQGRPIRLAVDAGYDKAFLTIVDSHVTTLITGFALFVFGSGPIKGFAVTLCLGIGINLFTAFIGTKVVFDLVNRRKLEYLSI